ncbi:MAG: Hsp20 family protein [Patescibacteria group bacterium]|jgi:HSP20 family protein
MPAIIKRDPLFRHLFAWPRWLDEFEEPTQRGLKIHETKKNIIAEAVVAGVPVENIDIHIEDGILTVKAEAKEEEEKEQEYKASSYQYYYTAALSGGQWNKAEAEIKDGIVKITIPKQESAKPKKITIKAKKS